MSKLEQSKKLYELCKKGYDFRMDIEKALKEGADINYSLPGYGLTPLHMAASIGDVQLINLLLSLGANPNPYTYNIKTPLDLFLSQHENPEAVAVMTSYGCHKAESKGAYFTKKVEEGVSPFMLDDMCIMKAFCGDGFKLYAAKSDSPTTVNFYGDDEKAPKLIGCIDKDGKIILTKGFSELYFSKGEKKDLHEYAYEYDKELRQRVMEEYKDSVFPRPRFEDYCERLSQKVKKTAIFKDAYGTGFDIPVEVAPRTAAEILCGKTSIEQLLQEIRNDWRLRKGVSDYVGFVNACKEKYESAIEPYEYAIAEAIEPYLGLEELTVYRRDEKEAYYSKNAITRTCEWWGNIDRIEKDGRVLYDSRDYEKENIER